jgi:hypothetical protein
MIKINAQTLCLICLQFPVAFSPSQSFATHLSDSDNDDGAPSIQRHMVQTSPVNIRNSAEAILELPLSLSPLERLINIRHFVPLHSERQAAFIELACDSKIHTGFRQKVAEHVTDEEKKAEILRKIQEAEM